MMTLPEVIEREARTYIFVPFTVRMNEMQRPAVEGFPLLFAYLDKHGIEPDGEAFYNYRRINMADTLDVEAGISIRTSGVEDGSVRVGTLPGGRFMTVQWHGHYDALQTVTGVLIGWSRLTNQPFDMEERADGDHFACRLEIYETDPDELPNPQDWVTTLSFKLKDA